MRVLAVSEREDRAQAPEPQAQSLSPFLAFL